MKKNGIECEMIHIVCECMNDEHTIRLVKFSDQDELDDTIFMTFHINHYPFIKRLWTAIKYIFKCDCKYGHFDEILLMPPDVNKICKFRDKINDKKHQETL